MLQQTLCHHAPRRRRRYCQISAKQGHTLEATTSNGKTKALRKDPPAGNQNPVVGKKRKSPNNKTSPNPKRMKEISNSEVHPLTTADILDIVAAVANVNRHKKPAQVRTSRRTLRSGNITSRDDSPSGDSQPSSDEESVEHEDFGKGNRTTRCTLYYYCFM